MENTTETMTETSQKNQPENWQQYYADGEQYVRSNPTKAALVAIGTGFLLAQLPLRYMFIALIKLLFLLVKPAAFIYAIAKLFEDVKAARDER